MAELGDIIDVAARSDNINQNGLVIDMWDQTALLDPGTFPLVALTRMAGKKVKQTKRMKHEFRERRLRPNFTSVLTAVTAANTTTLVVADPTYIKADMVLNIPSTGDQLGVASISGNDITVYSLTGTTGSGNIPNAIAVGARVIIGPEAHAEGEEVPAVYSIDSTNRFNYVMQSDRRVAATDIEEEIQHYDTSEQRRMDQRQGWIEYHRDMNILGYVGKNTREVTSASGPRRHVCSGMFEQFTENVVDVSDGAGFTIDTLAAILADTTPHVSSGMKVGLFGTNGWSQISAWPRNFLRETPGEKKRWGISLSSIITGYGTIAVGYDPQLNEDLGLADRAVIMDLSKISRLQLGGMAPKLIKGVTNLTSIHQVVDAMTGTLGWEAKLAELHAQIEGL